jgi:hypothetical protein
MSVEENEEEAAARRETGGSQELAEQSQSEWPQGQTQKSEWEGSPSLSQFQQDGAAGSKVEGRGQVGEGGDGPEGGGGDWLAKSQFEGEILGMAEMPIEGLRALASADRLDWLDELPEDLQRHLQNSPCATWRGFVSSRRRGALGKALVPILANAVLGRERGWKALAVAMRLLCRAPVRDKVPPEEGRRAKDGEFHRRLELARAGEWRQLAREYVEAQEKCALEARLRGEEGEDDQGGDGKSQKERAADRSCRLAQCGEWSRAAAAIAGPPIMKDQPGLAKALERKIPPPEEGEVRAWAQCISEVGPELKRRVAAQGTGVTKDAFEKAARTSAKGSAQSSGGLSARAVWRGSYCAEWG